MSMTIWVDTDKDKTIELGPTIPAYKAFAAMAGIVGDRWAKSWPALAGVTNQSEVTDDADPEWLEQVREEASSFLEMHRDALGADETRILKMLRDG